MLTYLSLRLDTDSSTVQAYIGSTALFVASSIGTALSPTLPVFFMFRAFTACQVTALLIVGPSCIADIYHPVRHPPAI